MLDARSLMIDARDLQGKHARARSMLETQCSYSIDDRKKSTRPITRKQVTLEYGKLEI